MSFAILGRPEGRDEWRLYSRVDPLDFEGNLDTRMSRTKSKLSALMTGWQTTFPTSEFRIVTGQGVDKCLVGFRQGELSFV